VCCRHPVYEILLGGHYSGLLFLHPLEDFVVSVFLDVAEDVQHLVLLLLRFLLSLQFVEGVGRLSEPVFEDERVVLVARALGRCCVLTLVVAPEQITQVTGVFFLRKGWNIAD
jgi:hypothetical protein